MPATITKAKLIEAEEIAARLFTEIQNRQLLVPGKTEKQVNRQVYELAKSLFGIKKHWHKRIVRSGENTLSPYSADPPDLVIQQDDIVFFDFGPVIEEWEADFGRTYVIGNNADKIRLRDDIEKAWHQTRAWFHTQTSLTGAQLWDYINQLAHTYGWEYGGQLGGHLIGHFPHERLEPKNYGLYVHPQNHNDMFLPDAQGNKREWILEIHFVDREKKIGGFFEQLLT
jgi:Xaa-Pro aminopeptidase